MTMQMTVHHLGEQRYVGFNGKGQQILLDNSEIRVGVSPMEALLGALASCTAYDIVGIMNKRRTPLTSYRVELQGERAEQTPRRYTRIVVRHVASGEGVTLEALEKAAHLSHEKYCSVAATLNCEIVLEVALDERAEPSAVAGQ
jgi:putative redox protein